MRHSASMSLPVNDMLLQRPSYVGGIAIWKVMVINKTTKYNQPLIVFRVCKPPMHSTVY